MISTVEEYIRLCDSDCQTDNRRTVMEELSQEVISKILHDYTDRISWLIHNKFIPADVLEILADSPDEDIRFTIAMKRCCNKRTFEKLSQDKSDSIRLMLVRNSKIPIEVLEDLILDKNEEISATAKKRISKTPIKYKSITNSKPTE